MFSVCHCRPITPNTILDCIKNDTSIPLELSRNVVRGLLAQSSYIVEDGDEIMVDQTHHSVTLTCPSTLMRIELPGRGVHCT